MYWSNFLHIYQPPTQKEIWVRRVTDESYRKLFRGLLEIPRGRLTLNINGILCELLARYDGGDVIDAIRTLLQRGQIELTGSAKYHAFLPFLPESEIERQIVLNEESLTKYFGDLWRPEPGKKSGFFSPEMAYSEKVARAVQKLGYQWILADELGFPGGQKPNPGTLYTVERLDDFGVFFRERNLSFAILSAQAGHAQGLLRYLGPRLGQNEYALTAMDGETFGHHRPGLEKLLFDLLKSDRIEPATVSDLTNIFSRKVPVVPRDSTWAATKKDMDAGMPFVRWNNSQNAIHVMQWELTNSAIQILNRQPADSKARVLLDSAVHSDQYWWASARPWWSLEMIERGAFELKNIIVQSSSAKKKKKIRAQELYQNIIFTGFEWQRSGLVDQLARQENEEIQERLEEKEKFFITQEEYGTMITTLEEQMRQAAASQEYHRAAMLQERIRELQEEMKKSRN